MIVQPRNKARTDLLELFDRGETPTSIFAKKGTSQNTSSFSRQAKNTVYRWYKIWLILEIKKSLDTRLITQDLKPVSQRDCEKILKWARTGNFD